MSRETRGGANGCNMLVMEIDELVALYHMKSPSDNNFDDDEDDDVKVSFQEEKENQQPSVGR